jgi:hypothetical protein
MSAEAGNFPGAGRLAEACRLAGGGRRGFAESLAPF